MPKKGSVCPMCGYIIKKWAVQCPKCRTNLEDDVDEKLVELARKHLVRMKKKAD